MKGRILLQIGVIFFVVGTGILLAQTDKVKIEDRLKLVSADSLVSISDRGETVWEIWGNVKLVQGEAFIECDAAKWWEKADSLALWGRVTIFDKKRTLKGDTIIYNGKINKETAIGRVSLRSGDRLLTSKRMDYLQDKEVAIAYGDVKIDDFIEQVTLQGQEALYDRVMDYGAVEVNACLTKIDTTTGEKMVVRAMKMEAWGEEQRVVITDSVRMEKSDMEAFCQKAVYHADEELLVLEAMPVVFFQNQEMRGDTIDIHLDDLKFKGGVIRGNANILSRNSTYQDELNGQMITMETKDDSSKKVVVLGQASSLYHIYNENDGESGYNTLTGDRIQIDFVGDRLVLIKVDSNPGYSTGVYRPSEKELILPSERNMN